MLIKIHVTTDAKKESVTKLSDDRYDIAVREPAEDNRANERIFELLRHLYPETRIRVVSGHHAPAKIISIDYKN
jgi:uncharacterized protein (TIGR00251 family)